MKTNLGGAHEQAQRIIHRLAIPEIFVLYYFHGRAALYTVFYHKEFQRRVHVGPRRSRQYLRRSFPPFYRPCVGLSAQSPRGHRRQ